VKDKPLRWVWIDGICHADLMKYLKFSMDKFPHVMVYDPQNSKFL